MRNGRAVRMPEADSGSRPARCLPGLLALVLVAVAAGCLTRYHPEPGPFNVGVDRLDQGRYADAVASFKRALELYPEDYRAHFNLACAYDAQGQPEKAREHYDAVLRIRPDNVPARLNLAAHARAAGDRDRAAALLEEASRADPDDPEGPSSRAQLALEEDDLETAQRFLTESLARDPKHAASLYRQGRLHERRNDAEGAAAAYRAALEVEPEDFVSLYRLGALSLAREDFAGAARYLERATLVRGGHRESWLALSRAYLALGRLENALLAAWEARDLAEGPEARAEDRRRLGAIYRRLLEAPAD